LALEKVRKTLAAYRSLVDRGLTGDLVSFRTPTKNGRKRREQKETNEKTAERIQSSLHESPPEKLPSEVAVWFRRDTSVGAWRSIGFFMRRRAGATAGQCCAEQLLW
jgi:hypothetical protein